MMFVKLPGWMVCAMVMCAVVLGSGVVSGAAEAERVLHVSAEQGDDQRSGKAPLASARGSELHRCPLVIRASQASAVCNVNPEVMHIGVPRAVLNPDMSIAKNNTFDIEMV